jgi:phage terminase large subunit-like protein
VNARSSWLTKARPEQVTPTGSWLVWLILAGRGFGKTRSGSEDVAWFGTQNAGSRIAVVAPTFASARDVCVEGESGLLAVLPRDFVANWNRSMGELTLINETKFFLYSAEAAERLRGPQHHRAWADEVASWQDADTWDQLTFGMRLGRHPQVVATTTPKPTPLIRKLVKAPGTVITRGTTFDNAANLPEGTLAHLRERYEGTRLGRQELMAELLEDVQGALWTAEMIDAGRVRSAPDLQRIVVAVDPSGTAGGGQGDDIGIIVAGKEHGRDGRFVVLEDSSCNLSPDGWARRVVEVFDRWGADRVVAERNFGGAMVEAVLRTASRNLPIRLVTASRGKVVRAEPVAALYEQGRVSHVGTFDALEDQMCAMTSAGYVGEGSPDRADALVWALSSLNQVGGYYLLEALAS